MQYMPQPKRMLFASDAYAAIPGAWQQFVITVPNAAFKQPQPLFGRKYWHADYHLIQDWLVQYYNRDNCGLPGSERNYLTNEEQRKCDEQRIKERFKQLWMRRQKRRKIRIPGFPLCLMG